MTTQDDRLFLITGATGTTGAETVRLLLERGHRYVPSYTGRMTAPTCSRPRAPRSS